jgi:surface polysaccharide O-acyltransferase-like enzyme
MLDLVNVLMSKLCACNELFEVRGLIVFVWKIIGVIQFAIPVLLIILGMLDLGKAVTAGEDKEIKAAQQLLGKRAISGIAVFFVIVIVKLVLSILPPASGSSSINAFVCDPDSIPSTQSVFDSNKASCDSNPDFKK